MTAVDAQRFTPLRVVPSGNECWWTLGPNIRNPHSTAYNRGICEVLNLGGGRCALVLPGGFLVDASSLAFQIRWKQMTRSTIRTVPEERVLSVDVLCTHPPFLPDPTDWQQITRRGEREHPGFDKRNWRYDNPW